MNGGLKMKKQKSLRQLSRELEISPAYLSMILSGKRKCPEKLTEKLQSTPGVHKLVNNQLWNSLYTQGVIGSSPIPPTILYGR